MKESRMTQSEFDSLPEYSCSLPTGVYVGKQWKTDRNFGTIDPEKNWLIGEYAECITSREKQVRVVWSTPYIMDENETLIRERLFGK